MSANAERGIERSALAATWHHKRLWLLHVVGNGGILGLAYAWLWIPDEKVWQLVFSAVLPLGMIAGALWLHGGTLAFFRQLHGGQSDRGWPAFRTTLTRLPALALWLVILYLILWLIAWIGGFVDDLSKWIASWLTMTLRSPVTPRSVAKVLGGIVWFMRWFLVPLALMSFALQVNTQGFSAFRARGIRRAWELFRRLRYWLAYAVLFVIGAYVPYKLVWWVPEVEGLSLEATGMAVRLVAAYLLAVTAWLILLSALGRLGSAPEGTTNPGGKPRSIQPSTASLP